MPFVHAALRRQQVVIVGAAALQPLIPNELIKRAVFMLLELAAVDFRGRFVEVPCAEVLNLDFVLIRKVLDRPNHIVHEAVNKNGVHHQEEVSQNQKLQQFSCLNRFPNSRKYFDL